MRTINKFKFHLLFILFLIILIVLTYRDYGIAWDEKFFLNMGKYYVYQLLKWLKFSTNLSTGGFVPTEIHLKGHGTIFDVITVILTLFFKRFNFETYHLIKAIMAVPIFILIGLIINKILNERVSLLSMVLLLFFPRLYGDIFQNSVDVPTALAFTAAVCYFVYYLGSNQKFWQQMLLGLTLAISISQRVVLGYLFFLNILTIFIVDLCQKKAVVKSILKILNITVWTVFFLHLIQPYLFSHPITGLFEMIAVSKNYTWTASVLFDGRWVMANQLPWYYLPKTILITVPEATIFLFVIGFVYLLYLFLIEGKDIIKKFIYIYFLLILIVPFILVFKLRPVLYDAWRHFLFLTTPIILIASFGIQAISRIRFKQAIVVAIFFLGFNLMTTAREMIILHPYQYIYYNSFVGGLKGAYGNYETDYLGAAYKEAVDWFNNNINQKDKKYTIISEGDPLSTAYYFKKNMELTNDYRKADYFFSFTRWDLQEKYPGKVIYTIDRDKTPLIFIKKL